MQSDLVRDSLEDKMRDLLEWTESVWKNDQHKVSPATCTILVTFYAEDFKEILHSATSDILFVSLSCLYLLSSLYVLISLCYFYSV